MKATLAAALFLGTAFAACTKDHVEDDRDLVVIQDPPLNNIDPDLEPSEPLIAPVKPKPAPHATPHPAAHAALTAPKPSQNRVADADNTARNVVDRDGSTLTPIDQSNSKTDLEITRSIRSAITSRDGMSSNARNIKIITAEGRVTLRGPVDNDNERIFIENLTRDTAGVKTISNNITVLSH